MRMNKFILFVITLAFCAGVFLCGSPGQVYASASAETETETDAETQPTVETETTEAEAEESLFVDSVWLEGDALHITVTATNTGLTQTLELNLREHANSGDEFVSVQAVDKAGNTSNTIQFKNPYYTEPAEVTEDTDVTEDAEAEGTEGADAGGVVHDPSEEEYGSNPLTPDGAGTVVDNAEDGDGKEFFSIETVDGNVFYLIVDRQRTTENVYLLNAVTEQDLAALAEDGAVSGGSVPIPEPTTEPETAPAETDEPDEEPSETAEKSSNIGALIFVGVAAVIAGGLGYYFKILKPKKAANSADDYDETENFDDADIYGETEGGGDE